MQLKDYQEFRRQVAETLKPYGDLDAVSCFGSANIAETIGHKMRIHLELLGQFKAMTDEDAKEFLCYLEEWCNEEKWLRLKVKEHEDSYLARYYAGGAENLAVHMMSQEEKERAEKHREDSRIDELLINIYIKYKNLK